MSTSSAPSSSPAAPVGLHDDAKKNAKRDAVAEAAAAAADDDKATLHAGRGVQADSSGELAMGALGARGVRTANGHLIPPLSTPFNFRIRSGPGAYGATALPVAHLLGLSVRPAVLCGRRRRRSAGKLSDKCANTFACA